MRVSVRSFSGKFLILSLCALSGIGAMRNAAANTVDLRNLPNNFEQVTFGRPNTVIYAQSVIADDLLMSEARARVHCTSAGSSIQFNFMITGDRPDTPAAGGLGFAPDLADIRFNSGLLTAPA